MVKMKVMTLKTWMDVTMCKTVIQAMTFKKVISQMRSFFSVIRDFNNEKKRKLLTFIVFIGRTGFEYK